MKGCILWTRAILLVYYSPGIKDASPVANARRNWTPQLSVTTMAKSSAKVSHRVYSNPEIFHLLSPDP